MKNTTISALQGMALEATQAAYQGRNTQALKLIRADRKSTRLNSSH